MAANRDPSSKNYVSKCSVRDGKFVDPCTPLSDSAEYGNPRGKQRGIWEWRLYKINDVMDEPARSFFGIKSGEYTAKGLAFHFCPFCGTDISAPLEKGETSRSSATTNEVKP